MCFAGMITKAEIVLLQRVEGDFFSIICTSFQSRLAPKLTWVDDSTHQEQQGLRSPAVDLHPFLATIFAVSPRDSHRRVMQAQPKRVSLLSGYPFRSEIGAGHRQGMAIAEAEQSGPSSHPASYGSCQQLL